MIAVDTNALVSFFSGTAHRASALVRQGLKDRSILLPPVVQTELLSDPRLPSAIIDVVLALPFITILPGYWQRAGILRAELIKKGRKAGLADILVAQSALDFDLPLLTADRDFEAIRAARNLILL